MDKCILLPNSSCSAQMCCVKCLARKITLVDSAIKALKGTIKRNDNSCADAWKIDSIYKNNIILAYDNNETGLLDDDILENLFHLYTDKNYDKVKTFITTLEIRMDSYQNILKTFMRRVKDGKCVHKEYRCIKYDSLLDINSFKSFNDSFSMDVGDLVLKRVFDYINERSRAQNGNNISINYAGDEFLIIWNEGLEITCGRHGKSEYSLNEQLTLYLNELRDLDHGLFYAVTPIARSDMSNENYTKKIVEMFRDEEIFITLCDKKFELCLQNTIPANTPYFIIKGISLHYGYGNSVESANINLIFNKKKDPKAERGKLLNDTYIDKDKSVNVNLGSGIMYFVLTNPEKDFPDPNIHKTMHQRIEENLISATKKAFISALYDMICDAVEKIKFNYTLYEQMLDGEIIPILSELLSNADEVMKQIKLGAGIDITNTYNTLITLFRIAESELKSIDRNENKQLNMPYNEIMSNCSNDILKFMNYSKLLSCITLDEYEHYTKAKLINQNEYSYIFIIEIDSMDDSILKVFRDKLNEYFEKIVPVELGRLYSDSNAEEQSSFNGLSILNCSGMELYPSRQ